MNIDISKLETNSYCYQSYGQGALRAPEAKIIITDDGPGVVLSPEKIVSDEYGHDTLFTLDLLGCVKQYYEQATKECITKMGVKAGTAYIYDRARQDLGKIYDDVLHDILKTQITEDVMRDILKEGLKKKQKGGVR